MYTSTLFVFVWAAVAFFVLRFISANYFHEKNRATVASAAVALTFLVTSLSHSDLGTVAAPTVVASPSAVAAVAEPPPTSRSPKSPCADTASSYAPGAVGSLDVAQTGRGAMQDGASLTASEKLVLAGWAIDKSKSTTAQMVCITVDGKMNAKAQSSYGVGRADVATAYHNDAVTPSGFAVELPLAGVPRGKHTFGIAVESHDGTWATLAHQFTFTIT